MTEECQICHMSDLSHVACADSWVQSYGTLIHTVTAENVKIFFIPNQMVIILTKQGLDVDEFQLRASL